MDVISISVFCFAMLAILCAVVGCISVILRTTDPWSGVDSFIIVAWSIIIIINVSIMLSVVVWEQCSIYFAVVIAYFIVMTILNIAMRCMRSRKRSIVAVIVNVIAILLFIGAIHTHFEDKANIEFHEDNVKQIEIKITTRQQSGLAIQPYSPSDYRAFCISTYNGRFSA